MNLIESKLRLFTNPNSENSFKKPMMPNSSSEKASFYDILKSGVESVNESSKSADKMASELASGKSESIHETMIAVTQAELQFNLLVQLRNKALESYQEIMRLPV